MLHPDAAVQPPEVEIGHPDPQCVDLAEESRRRHIASVGSPGWEVQGWLAGGAGEAAGYA
jgi:hypothetical protein